MDNICKTLETISSHKTSIMNNQINQYKTQFCKMGRNIPYFAYKSIPTVSM